MLLSLLQATPTPFPMSPPAPVTHALFIDPITAATCITAACTVAYSVLTYLILRATAANTRVTKQIFEAAHRPYLGISNVDTELSQSQRQLKFTCTLKNFGSTPAHNIEVVRHEVIIPNVPPSELSLKSGKFSVFPNNERFINVNFDTGFTLIPILTSGKLELLVYLRYTGVTEKSYAYNYHAVYDPNTGQLVPVEEQST